MTQSEIKLRKMKLDTGFLPSFTAVIIVILGVIVTSIIPVAQAGATTQTGQDGPSQVNILGLLTPINEAKGIYHAPVCPGQSKDAFRCHSRVVVDRQGNPITFTVPSGYGPAQFLGAYNLSGKTTSNQIIAIVDAYDDPNIFSDLNYYSNTSGIQMMKSCSVSNFTATSPCFQKVDQNGGTRYPRFNSGWAVEISLDVEIAHAICQNCNILLVEANSNSYTNLMAAVDRARMMGANVISNSYGSGEFSGETSYDSHFNYQGIAFTFSSGDNGYGASYPAASQYVTAVGGTTLTINNDNSYNSETVWSGAGSGCSAYEPQTFQTLMLTPDQKSLCSKRVITDVSADADPNPGAAVYDTAGYYGHKGWFTVGGTSLSSPLVAGVYALAGGVAAGIQGNSIPYNQMIYATNLHDITSGSNGNCGGSYLCTAVNGYDGPTGLGTPMGIGDY